MIDQIGTDFIASAERKNILANDLFWMKAFFGTDAKLRIH